MNLKQPSLLSGTRIASWWWRLPICLRKFPNAFSMIRSKCHTNLKKKRVSSHELSHHQHGSILMADWYLMPRPNPEEKISKKFRDNVNHFHFRQTQKMTENRKITKFENLALLLLLIPNSFQSFNLLLEQFIIKTTFVL